MSKLSIFVAEHKGKSIRMTPDGQFSVYDVLVAFGCYPNADTARITFGRICKANPEVSTFCSDFKFPGRGQRETPVTTEEGMYQILMLCPGHRGAEFRQLAAKVLRERREEESNPELAYNRGRHRAIAAWKRQGKTDQEIDGQLKLIEARCHFTDTLKAHGVSKPQHYAMITNEIYKTLLGGTASDIKQERGLAKGDRLRDSISRSEAAALYLAEVLASEDIESQNRQGFRDCHGATQDAASRVKRVFE